MEQQCCFKIYIVRTKATRISITVFFKHRYITNPKVSPKTMAIQTAQQLTSALQGNVAPETKAAEVLWRVSKLFMKISLAKASAAKAKEQQNQLQTHPEARCATPFPRVAEPNPRLEISLPRVITLPEADNCTAKNVASPPKQWQVAQAPATHSQSRLPRENMQSSTARPNYISQDKVDDPTPKRRATRSRSIMQEAMLSCIDITSPMCKISPSQLSQQKFPMKWLCKMANLVIGDNGELLEYHHLIANPKTKAVWAHLYGNELGQLAQGMPGQNTGTNTIVFIRCNQVPPNRTKDVTYGLITCVIQPEKVEEPNRTRLVARGDRVHYPGNAGTPTADLLTVKLLINTTISTAGAKFMTMDIQDFYLNTPMA
jgi:hypothetical protein